MLLFTLCLTPLLRSLKRELVGFQTPAGRKKFTQMTLKFSSLNKDEYDNYVRSEGEKLKHDPKRFWSFVDQRRNRKHMSSTMSFDQTQTHNAPNSANLFADFFGSVFTESSLLNQSPLTILSRTREYLTLWVEPWLKMRYENWSLNSLVARVLDPTESHPASWTMIFGDSFDYDFWGTNFIKNISIDLEAGFCHTNLQSESKRRLT